MGDIKSIKRTTAGAAPWKLSGHSTLAASIATTGAKTRSNSNELI